MARFSDSDDFEWEEDDDDEEASDADPAAELQELVDRADEMAETGGHRRAVRLWRKNIDRFADEPQAYFHYAQACFRLLSDDLIHDEMWESNADDVGVYEEALAALEEALTMDKEHVDSLNMIGALYVLRSNKELAIDSWERSLKANPNQPQVRTDLKGLKGNDEDEDDE